MGSNPLKYRFIAEYTDGTVFQQNDGDVSLVDPKRSAFFDVDQSRLRTFSLWSEDRSSVALVDLTDGHFEVNAVHFKLYEGTLQEPLQVIFFRKHRHEINAVFHAGDNGSFVNASNEEMGHSISFRLGWKSGDIERVIEIL